MAPSHGAAYVHCKQGMPAPNCEFRLNRPWLWERHDQESLIGQGARCNKHSDSPTEAGFDHGT